MRYDSNIYLENIVKKYNLPVDIEALKTMLDGLVIDFDSDTNYSDFITFYAGSHFDGENGFLKTWSWKILNSGDVVLDTEFRHIDNINVFLMYSNAKNKIEMSIYKAKSEYHDDDMEWCNGLYYYTYNGLSEKIAYYDEETFKKDSYGCIKDKQKNLTSVGILPDAIMELQLFSESNTVAETFNRIWKEFNYDTFLEIAKNVQEVREYSNIPIRTKRK